MTIQSNSQDNPSHDQGIPSTCTSLTDASYAISPRLSLLSSIISRNLLTISLSRTNFSSFNAPGPLFLVSSEFLRLRRLPLITKPICSKRSMSFASWPYSLRPGFWDDGMALELVGGGSLGGYGRGIGPMGSESEVESWMEGESGLPDGDVLVTRSLFKGTRSRNL